MSMVLSGTPGRRLTEHARQRPAELAVLCGRLDERRDRLTWAELEARANSLARRLAAEDVGQGDFVVIGLDNGIDHFVASQAAWKVGACATPLGATLPARERDELLALARPKVIIADWPDLRTISSAELTSLPERFSSAAMESDPTPQPFKAIASGGSTGRPKLIVTPSAFAAPGGRHPLAELLMINDRDLMLSPGPLYHNQAFVFSALALYSGASVAVTERFRPDLTLDLVEGLRVTYLNIVPTMMTRMLREESFAERDLSSLRVVLHGAAPCPDWVKRSWIERVGPDRMWEGWGSTEVTGFALINGAEWLRRPGSVGRPAQTAVKIIGPDGSELPPGDVGEIYSKVLIGDGPSYAYLGADPLPELEGGYRSVGDLGWVDGDGYLYLADRRTDLILSGGSNVYPAEVEQALSAHPDVMDVVVIGVHDADLGQRVHAIVQPRDSATPPDEAGLRALCRERIAPYKMPRSYEYVSALPRDDAGKIRRSALRAEREGA